MIDIKYIGLAFIIGALIFFLTTYFSSKNTYVNTSAKKEQKDLKILTIEKHNAISAACVSTENKFNEILQKTQRQIILYSDNAAFERLKYFVDQYDVLAKENVEYLSASMEYVSKEQYYLSINTLTKIEDNLAKIREYKRAVEFIEIDKRNDSQQALDDLLENSTNNSLAFFSGCNNLSEVDYRYKSLVKAFHPDNKGGDKDLFNKLQEEYAIVRYSFYE